MPGAMLEIIIGTKNGETLLGPAVLNLSYSSHRVSMPPIPIPKITPTRNGSRSLKSLPESLTAISAAATANWQKRPIFLTSFFSIKSVGSKLLTCAATFTFKSEVSKRSIVQKPCFPAFTFSHISSFPIPIGVIAPTPVITTLLILILLFDKTKKGKPPVLS